MEMLKKPFEPKLSVVIPCYNDGKALQNNLPYLVEFLKNEDHSWELLVVDDGSVKADFIKKVTHENGGIYLRHSENLGKGAALKTGILQAKGDIILFTDSDIPYDLKSLKQALKLIEFQHSEIAVGSRALTNSSHIGIKAPILRRFANKIFANVVYRLTKLPYKDTQCGFKVFSRKSAHKLFSKSRVKGFVIDIEILVLADLFDFKVKEIPVYLRSNEGQSVHLWYHSFKMLKGVHGIRKKYRKKIAS